MQSRSVATTPPRMAATPGSATRSRGLLLAAGTIAVACMAVLALLRQEDDGLGRYPHAFASHAGYDPAALTIVEAPIELPPEPPAGCLPAWRCDDPDFNDAQGRPWIFPMAGTVDAPPTPPSHPLLKRSPALDRCSIHRTPEAQAMLDAYRSRRAP